MDPRVAARTDVGLVRDQNQDAYLNDDPLYAVADGMGGHLGGEVASQLALEVIGSNKDRIRDGGLDGLRDAVLEANRAVFRRGSEDSTLEGMGTTLTVGWLEEGVLNLAHVGDSRAYLLRRGTLSRLTEDQTLVAQWEREGKIDPGEATSHPQRHILQQAVGSHDDVDVDLTTVELRPGDRLLLSTDGLHGVVGNEERIEEILRTTSGDPDRACAELVELAKSAGGNDNVTVLVLDVVGADEAATDDPDPVIVSKPGAAKTRTRSPRWRSRRVVLGILGALVGAAALALVTLLPADEAYLVGVSGDHVAILQGTPGREGDPPDAEVVRVYEDVPVSSIARTSRRELRSGLVAESLGDAERIVATLPRVLGPQDTPSPSPSAAPGTPTPAPTLPPATAQAP